MQDHLLPSSGKTGQIIPNYSSKIRDTNQGKYTLGQCSFVNDATLKNEENNNTNNNKKRVTGFDYL